MSNYDNITEKAIKRQSMSIPQDIQRTCEAMDIAQRNKGYIYLYFRNPFNLELICTYEGNIKNSPKELSFLAVEWFKKNYNKKDYILCFE